MDSTRFVTTSGRSFCGQLAKSVCTPLQHPEHHLVPTEPSRNARLPFSVLSRRAFVVAASALLAAVPSAEGGHRKPPLAFVGATISKVEVGPDGTTFVWTFQAVLSHPSSGFKDDLSGTANSGVKNSQEATRTQIVTALKSFAATALQGTGHPVSQDRIAVTLI